MSASKNSAPSLLIIESLNELAICTPNPLLYAFAPTIFLSALILSSANAGSFVQHQQVFSTDYVMHAQDHLLLVN